MDQESISSTSASAPPATSSLSSVPFPNLNLNPGLEGTFLLSHSAQLQSSLLKVLPTELRRIILANLLYSSHPLQYIPSPDEYARTLGRAHKRDFGAGVGMFWKENELGVSFFPWSDWRSIARPSFSFSTSVLATCQALYYEGIEVLYRDNVLAISWTLDHRFKSLWRSPGSWHILAECDHGPMVGSPNQLGVSQIITQLWKKVNPAQEPDPWSMHSRWDYTNVAIALARMTRFEIRMTSCVPLAPSSKVDRDAKLSMMKPKINCMLRSMMEVMRGKDVTLVFEDDDLTEADLQSLISSIEAIAECRSLVTRLPNERSEVTLRPSELTLPTCPSHSS